MSQSSRMMRKLRQLTRRMGREAANRNMELYHSMPLWARLKVAYRIIFKV